MGNVKRIFCLVLSAALMLCAAGTAAFADSGGGTEITGVKFISNGTEVRKFPAPGEPVSAEVTSGADTLALVLAAYDAGGRLVDTAVSTEGAAVGPVTMTGEIETIRLLAWNDLEQMVPASGQVYILTDTDPDNPGALQEFIVNGVPAVMEGSAITASVPVWNAQGDANTAWTVSTVTKEGTGTVTVGTVSMQAGEEKALALEPCSVTVTENGKTAVYQLNLRYTIKEDFDNNSVFDSSYLMTGSETVQNAWAQGNIVKGNLARNTFKISITNTKTDTMAAQQPNLRAGVKSISEATKTDGITPMDTVGTSAAGKALMIGKTTSIDNNTDCGQPVFSVENLDLFQHTDIPIIVEYDLAVDYSKAESGIIGLNGGGIRYNAKEQYNLFDAYADVNMPTEDQATLKLRTNDGKANINTDTGAKINRWHHIRQVFDKKTNTATTYVDGTAYMPDYDLTNAGGYQDALKLNFSTSSRRAADIWIDNLQLTWGRNYSPLLNSMTAAGEKAVIDSANSLITVNLPLWNADGEAVDASAVSVVLNGSGETAVGETVVPNDTATVLDLTQAKQVTVGSGEAQKTYDMGINRTIFDDFDQHTVFSGELVGSSEETNAWAGDGKMITGAKANSVLQMNLANGAVEYQPYVSAAVTGIASARGLDQQQIAVSPSSGAAGNALRLRKTKSKSGTNTGNPFLVIKSDDFKDAKNSIAISYDLAFDYNNVIEGNRGLLGAGARYNSQNAAAVTDNAQNTAAMPTAAYPRIYFGEGDAAGPFSTFMNCPPNAWIHVEIVIDVPKREMKTTATLLNTTTQTEMTRTVNSGVLDGGTGINNGKEYKRATWNDQLNYTFATSAQRGADLWVDNLSIAYDVSSTIQP